MSKTPTSSGIVYFDGQWHSDNPMVIGPASNAVWMTSAVFDGARAFDGVAPDLNLHCARAIRSAHLVGLEPTITAEEIEVLAWEGIARMPADVALYVCPQFYAESGFISPDPQSTRFALIIKESPLPPADGFSACLSSFRRPATDMAPTEAKASSLYPNVARALREAKAKEFDTAVMLDPDNFVAEFAYANLFMVKGGTVHTPLPNGTFLNGITRQRVIKLLLGADVRVVERSIEFEELGGADELFGTGNYYKVAPCSRLEDQTFEYGPICRKARELYFEFARTCTPPG